MTTNPVTRSEAVSAYIRASRAVDAINPETGDKVARRLLKETAKAVWADGVAVFGCPCAFADAVGREALAKWRESRELGIAA